ncbi:hypothetical protein BDK51DRAFT_38380 [Blyttiomyces helicus]|uniref:Uncharacterized protein n=1 Tax=Blyttiomyces helicus TaxID=388810 RepID=A0A4P9WJJ8_9FUNG|nr:hypothetical protein BDK51DRAFT_38380 [Blyttiomyces helicus]|eukprot:RKO93101.1 hypothetical protein BDK51DRAFT_38380 [Blyttiomyces helicus]
MLKASDGLRAPDKIDQDVCTETPDSVPYLELHRIVVSEIPQGCATLSKDSNAWKHRRRSEYGEFSGSRLEVVAQLITLGPFLTICVCSSCLTVMLTSNNAHPISPSPDYLYNKRVRDARHPSEKDAAHRIMGGSLPTKTPSVIRLPVHLEGEQKITGFFTKPRSPDARICNIDVHCSYAQVPQKPVWAKDCWKLLKQSHSLGQMGVPSAFTGDISFFRTLFASVIGAISIENMQTFNGMIYSTLREACVARRLLFDNGVLDQTLTQIASSSSPGYGVNLAFALILISNQLCNSGALWAKQGRQHDCRLLIDISQQDFDT